MATQRLPKARDYLISNFLNFNYDGKNFTVIT